MIGMETLEELLKAVLWTGWVKDEKPVSLLIIAEPEEGKTMLIDKAKYLRGIIYLTDTTAYGVATELEDKKNLNERVNHIIIPDLLTPLSRQKVTAEKFVSFLNPLIEEGITYLKTGAIKLKYEFQCGVITAITRGKWRQHHEIWRDIGFMSRFIPVSYGYSMREVQGILRSVVNGEYQREPKFKFDFPSEKIEVKLNKEYGTRIIPISTALGAKLGSHGIRLQKSLQVLMKAHALMNNRAETNEEDFNAIVKFSDFINFDFKKI